MANSTFDIQEDSSGNAYRIDVISGVSFPAAKITLGAEGADDGYVASGNPMPIDIREYGGSTLDASNPLHVISGTGATFVVLGGTAADAALSANPVTMGGRASTAVPTAVSGDGDVVNLWLSRNGAANVTIRDASGNALSLPQYSDTISGSEYGIPILGAYPTGSGEWLPLYMDEDGRVRVIVDENNAITTGTSLIRSATWSSDKALASASPGTLSGLIIYNPNSSITWLHLYTASSTGSVTLGTTTPKLSFPIPALGHADIPFSRAVTWITGLVLGQTTTETGSTGPSSALVVNVMYQV